MDHSRLVGTPLCAARPPAPKGEPPALSAAQSTMKHCPKATRLRRPRRRGLPSAKCNTHIPPGVNDCPERGEKGVRCRSRTHPAISTWYLQCGTRSALRNCVVYPIFREAQAMGKEFMVEQEFMATRVFLVEWPCSPERYGRQSPQRRGERPTRRDNAAAVG